MSKYRVSFKQHYNDNGETDDNPTDFLLAGMIQDMDFIKMQDLPLNPGSDGFCTAIWEYEIDDDDEFFFEQILDACPTVISYKQKNLARL